MLAWVFILVGGILQGLGANVSRHDNSDVAWGGLGVVVGGVLSIWFARRLGWWLVLFIPAIWILMVPIALITEMSTARIVGTVTRATSSSPPDECDGWSNLAADLAPISTSVQAWSTDLTSTENPDTRDVQRWSDDAGRIREQYERLDHPVALDHYVELSIQGFGDYEQGFSAMARGDYDGGQVLLDRGDSRKTQAQAEFTRANTLCVN